MHIFYNNFMDMPPHAVSVTKCVIRRRGVSPLIPSPGVCHFDAVPHDVLVYLFAYWEMPSGLAHVLSLRRVCTRWRDAVAAGHYDVDIRHLSHVITDARLQSLVKCMPRTRVLHVQLGDAITNDSIVVRIFCVLFCFTSPALVREKQNGFISNVKYCYFGTHRRLAGCTRCRGSTCTCSRASR